MHPSRGNPILFVALKHSHHAPAGRTVRVRNILVSCPTASREVTVSNKKCADNPSSPMQAPSV